MMLILFDASRFDVQIIAIYTIISNTCDMTAITAVSNSASSHSAVFCHRAIATRWASYATNVATRHILQRGFPCHHCSQ